jgi:glycosyltransferase involved in cell wall biosynthesis
MKINPDVSIGFVSTYPPTVCGLATYTESLLGAIAETRGTHVGLGVVTMGDAPATGDRTGVVYRHRTGSTRSRARAVRTLNAYDTVSIQHEFGIFGGKDGREVIDLMEAISVPTTVTLHTVLDQPTPHQRAIVERMAVRANRLVVMTETAATVLRRRYAVDAGRIEVIPHGANTLFSGPSLATGSRPMALTWGLIGPGKGLESVISAFAQLTDLHPVPRYVIAGATHPRVRETAGESYREGLVSLVHELGLEHMVEFDGRYFDRSTLARLVRSSDLVVLPYASTQQVTSGCSPKPSPPPNPSSPPASPTPWNCSVRAPASPSPTVTPMRWRPPCAMSSPTTPPEPGWLWWRAGWPTDGSGRRSDDDSQI